MRSADDQAKGIARTMWPGTRRACLLAVVMWLPLIGTLAAQETSGRITLYETSANQYRELAGKAAGERRNCLLTWAAYYDSLAAGLRSGSAALAKPSQDSECKKVSTTAATEQGAQAAPAPIRAQSPAAELFDGLRYDMVTAASGAKSLSPEIRTKLDALDLILNDITAAAPERRARYLEEFLTASASVVGALPDHPYKVGLLSLRTAAFQELNRADAGRVSARQLFEAGGAKGEGPTLRQFMATLERQGWLAQGGGAPAPATGPSAAKTPAATPVATPSAASTTTDLSSLAGSVWSGTLVAQFRNRKEAARYNMDIHFAKGGGGKAIYRNFNPVLAWTQSGSQAAVKMELVAGCVLSLDLVTGDGTLSGVGNWNNIPRDDECVKAAGGIASGSTPFTRQLAVPREFSATRIAFAPNDVRPVADKPAGTPRNAPVAVSRVAPVYPPKAEQLSLAGWVVVLFTVAADGRVKDAVVRESTSSLFNEAALTAVSQWQYKPPTNKKGVPTDRPGVSVVITFKVPD